jgi:hypothetical protein
VNVLYALICEEANGRTDGRVDVTGIYQHLYAPGFPAQQDRMVLMLAVEWDAGETGRQEFRIDLVDPSGSPVATISGHTDVAPRRAGEAPPQTRIVTPMERVVFPTAGTYRFEMHVGKKRTRLTPVHLLHNPDAK